MKIYLQTGLVLLIGNLAFRAVAIGLETPKVLNFDKSTYQAQNQNWMIAQSPDGFLYFGNNAGLLEYDGARWNLFTLPEQQTVRAVAFDGKGFLFTGGYGEFGFWKREPSGR